MPAKKRKPEPKKKRKYKSDTTEVLLRIEEVLAIRLDGAQFHDVVQYSAEKGWNLKHRQIREYMGRADDLLVERQEKSRKRIIAHSFAQRESLIARSINAADYRTAGSLIADRDKLRGLYPEKGFRDIVKLAAEQSLRIAELEKRLRDAQSGGTPAPLPEKAVAPPGPTPGPTS